MIEKLMELGLSEYEARAYVALLESSPATAYETAKKAGIPTSKIYEVLERLTARGVAQAYEDGDRRKYVPLEADQFLDAQNLRLSATIGSLREDFADLSTAQAVSLVWNIRDYRSLTAYLTTLIDSAQESLLLSAWPEEIPAIVDCLKSAETRGVRIATVLFCEGDPLEAGAARAKGSSTAAGAASAAIGEVYRHPIGDTLYSEKGGRGITAVSDGKQALVATISATGGVEGAWSRNAGFVTLAEDYVKHDIYIMKIVERFDGDLIRKFGDGYSRLRDVFSDTEQ